MKNRLRILILSLFFLFEGILIASAENMYINASYFNDVKEPELNAMGYTCVRKRCNKYGCDLNGWDVLCARNINVTSISSYGATKEDYQTLNGYANYITVNYNDSFYVDLQNTPFLYLQNPPNGNISVNIDSERNKYYPKPDFNQENGWLVESKDDKLSVNGEEKDNLFYELETSKITLNRNGKNFSSKDEIIDYLNNSDFLTKLGFSEEEKNNSLEYFIPKLKESEDNNYYYLTILSDKSVENISTLSINPKPDNIVRQYFAVYPTPVPVKTNGEFKFPENKTTNEFTAKETGEFLVEEPMQVFFD